MASLLTGPLRIETPGGTGRALEALLSMARSSDREILEAEAAVTVVSTSNASKGRTLGASGANFPTAAAKINVTRQFSQVGSRSAASLSRGEKKTTYWHNSQRDARTIKELYSQWPFVLERGTSSSELSIVAAWVVRAVTVEQISRRRGKREINRNLTRRSPSACYRGRIVG